jgi:hypothetical protein
MLCELKGQRYSGARWTMWAAVFVDFTTSHQKPLCTLDFGRGYCKGNGYLYVLLDIDIRNLNRPFTILGDTQTSLAIFGLS